MESTEKPSLDPSGSKLCHTFGTLRPDLNCLASLTEMQYVAIIDLNEEARRRRRQRHPGMWHKGPFFMTHKSLEALLIAAKSSS